MQELAASSSSHPSSKALVCVGQIIGAHGLQGHIKVKSFTQDPRNLFTFPTVYDQHKQCTFQFEKKVSQEGSVFIARVTDVASRTQAEALKGIKLFIERDDLPDMADEDTFYHTDLVGLRALDQDRQPFGSIKGVHNFGAGDILEITEKTMTRWAPFTRDFVPEIHVQEGFVTIDTHLLTSFDASVEEERKS